jgi:ABC-type lipoprotein export system ATPase subunit
MSAADAILIFDAVSSEGEGWRDTPIKNLTFSLRPGELGLIGFDRRSARISIPEAAMGLLDLNEGEVTFLQQPWSALSTRAAATQRGKIGRLYGKSGWVYHLDVDENVTLAQRHHTRRPIAEIEEEAKKLAIAFGLSDGVPGVRPNNVSQIDLQRSACVRMLLGLPPLIVVDEPPAGLHLEVYSALCEQIPRALARGAAVLWLSADPGVLVHAMKPAIRMDLSLNGTLISNSEGS